MTRADEEHNPTGVADRLVHLIGRSAPLTEYVRRDSAARAECSRP
ncbi:hypothetical protein SHIRM173S_03390 [Streptomyces hirsutus]